MTNQPTLRRLIRLGNPDYWTLAVASGSGDNFIPASGSICAL